MGFTVEQLQELGFLDEQVFIRSVKDRQGKFLRPDQILRVAGFTRIADVPAVLSDLQSEREDWPIVLGADECYKIMEACWTQWKAHDVFPFDTARCPEPYAEHELPSVVKESMVRIHISYSSREDLAYILRLHSGEELAKEMGPRGEKVPIRQWDRMLQDIQRSPIETRLCRFKGCNERVVTTVSAARNAIRVYGLIPEDNRFASAFFRTHTLCIRHAQVRDERLAAKRSGQGASPAPQRPRRRGGTTKGGRLAAPIGDHIDFETAKRLREQAETAPQQQHDEDQPEA